MRLRCQISAKLARKRTVGQSASPIDHSGFRIVPDGFLSDIADRSFLWPLTLFASELLWNSLIGGVQH